MQLCTNFVFVILMITRSFQLLYLSSIFFRSANHPSDAKDIFHSWTPVTFEVNNILTACFELCVHSSHAKCLPRKKSLRVIRLLNKVIIINLQTSGIFKFNSAALSQLFQFLSDIHKAGISPSCIFSEKP